MARTLFTPHPLVLQAAFSDLKRHAREQHTLLIGSPGSVVTREVKCSSLFYRDHYGPDGRKAADYIGPIGDDTARKRAAELREQISLSSALLTDARLLGQQGFARVD